MRKQIAAANWKMNLTWQEAEILIEELLLQNINLSDAKQMIVAVPFPYLQMAFEKVKINANINIAAQNCYYEKSGAYTGEVSLSMLSSIDIKFVLVGHSERRTIFNESNEILAKKINACLAENITPIFCCGEPLEIREANTQNEFVINQLKESIFQLNENEIQNIIIAYEPIWAIGTGKTASDDQAQEMHFIIREAIAKQYNQSIANNISILYGGSVKANNAENLFKMADVDGGLVGGASLVASDFATIANALHY